MHLSSHMHSEDLVLREWTSLKFTRIDRLSEKHEPKEPFMRFAKYTAWLPLIFISAGCNVWETLKEITREELPLLSEPNVRLEVTPSTGIAIHLDGKQVATSAPWILRNVPEGLHTLEIRAMGYFPVQLPLDVKRGESLRVPIVLRPRKPVEFIEKEPVPQTEKEEKKVDALIAVSLRVSMRPKAPIMLEGVPVVIDQKITFKKPQGTLDIGEMRLLYRLEPEGKLFLRPTIDQGIWDKDTQPIEADEEFAMTTGSVKLHRMSVNGTDQHVTITRE